MKINNRKPIAEKLAAFERLLTTMDTLREQCPWDKQQTMESLRPMTIEEMYELVDAITDGDLAGVKEELGDLMLHFVFYARIGEERAAFDVADILHQLCDKLERRHPHIYGNTQLNDAEEVLKNWEQIKLSEGKKSALEGVPVSLPALIKAVRIQQKAKKVGFEWDETAQVWEKVQEELEELQEAIYLQDKENTEKEFGDVLFALVNYARFIEVDPELALERTNKKFINRFMAMEKVVQAQGKQLMDMTLREMDAVWEEVKKEFR